MTKRIQDTAYTRQQRTKFSERQEANEGKPRIVPVYCLEKKFPRHNAEEGT
jgi:hypothetical protein